MISPVTALAAPLSPADSRKARSSAAFADRRRPDRTARIARASALSPPPADLGANDDCRFGQAVQEWWLTHAAASAACAASHTLQSRPRSAHHPRERRDLQTPPVPSRQARANMSPPARRSSSASTAAVSAATAGHHPSSEPALVRICRQLANGGADLKRARTTADGPTVGTDDAETSERGVDSAGRLVAASMCGPSPRRVSARVSGCAAGKVPSAVLIAAETGLSAVVGGRVLGSGLGGGGWMAAGSGSGAGSGAGSGSGSGCSSAARLRPAAAQPAASSTL